MIQSEIIKSFKVTCSDHGLKTTAIVPGSTPDPSIIAVGSRYFEIHDVEANETFRVIVIKIKS